MSYITVCFSSIFMINLQLCSLWPLAGLEHPLNIIKLSCISKADVYLLKVQSNNFADANI